MTCEAIKARRNGFVIVVVLCIVILMTAMVLGFNRRTQMTLRAAESFTNSRRARACALAGLNLAIAAVKNNPSASSETSSDTLLGRPINFELDDVPCTVTLAEETGKININFLKTPNGQENRAAIDQLLRLIELLNRHRPEKPITYDIVPSIIDWTDTDEHVTCLPFVKNHNLGAESDYYTALSPPYKTANTPFDSIDQLLLVKGVTPEAFEMLKPFLTVYGDGAININTAPSLVLESMSEKMDPALAKLIIERRDIKPYQSVEELRSLPAMTDEIYLTISRTATVRPTAPCYQVVSRATAGRASVTIASVLKPDSQTGAVEVLSYKEL
ncbi:MAG: type II secretion system minor pseudopilin GspK [Planctomycetota bacterium]